MWKSKGLSDKSIKSPVASNNSLYSNTKIRVKLDDRCLKQEKVTFKHKQLVNIYIFLRNFWTFNVCKYFALKNSLIWVDKLTNNPDPDKYKNPDKYWI